MIRITPLNLFILTLCTPIATTAAADVTFNGFATIAGGKVSQEDVEYQNLNDEFSYKDLSLFALQATADLEDNLSAAVQILARGTNDFNAEFEWAYVKYQFNDQLDVKVGRLRQPTYYYSEFIDVSYAYHWISPPSEFYFTALTAYDGISFLYSDSIGHVDYSLQVGTGKSEKVFGDLKYTGKYDAIINADFTYGPWSTKLIYIKIRSTFESEGIDQIQAAFPDYPNEFALSNKGLSTAGIASYLNLENFFIGAEYAQLGVEGLIVAFPEDHRLMATTGYRMNDWLLHYTYGNSDKNNDIEEFNKNDPRYPYVLGVIGESATETTTHTLGLVYDFHPSAKLKFEAGTIEVDLTEIDTNFIRAGVALVF